MSSAKLTGERHGRNDVNRIPTQVQHFKHRKFGQRFLRYVVQEIVFQVKNAKVPGVLKDIIFKAGSADFVLKIPKTLSFFGKKIQGPVSSYKPRRSGSLKKGASSSLKGSSRRRCDGELPFLSKKYFCRRQYLKYSHPSTKKKSVNRGLEPRNTLSSDDG